MNACVPCQASVKVRVWQSQATESEAERCIVSQKWFRFNLNLSRNLLNLMRFSKLRCYVRVLSACRARVFIHATHRLHRAPNSQLFHAFTISRDSKDISSRSLFILPVFLLLFLLGWTFRLFRAALSMATHVQHQLSTPSPLRIVSVYRA